MKRTLLLLCLLPALVAAHPVQRTVLVETYTNVSCASCATANPVTHQYMLDHGSHQVVNVQFHVNWPAPNDPFYLVDPGMQTTRRIFSGITNVSALVVGGTERPQPGSYTALDAACAAVQLHTSPLRMRVAAARNGGQLDGTVTIVGTAPVPAGNWSLFTTVVDQHVHYDTPPGNNGETDFYWSARAMWPDAGGSPLTVSEGDSLVIPFSVPVDAGWDSPDLAVIAWVQDTTTREVLQAAGSMAPAAYAFSYYGERRAKVAPQGEIYAFASWLENAGTQADTYTVEFTTDVPDGWSVTACSGTTCYPPWVTRFDVPLDPGAEQFISMDVTPAGTGTGTVTVTVTSAGDPSLQVVRQFTLIAAGDEVLYVDADGGQDTDSYFTTALDDAGATHATWSRSEYGDVQADDLQYYATVIWNADLALPALPATARDVLATYVTAGGNLLLTGQDVIADLCDPASGHSSDATRQWAADLLGVQYVADDANGTLVAGISGDPVFGGFAAAITGGDGTNDQDYPDALAAAPHGLATMTYNSGDVAAVRATPAGKTVTLGFGFTGLSSAASRQALLSRVLAWFRDTTVDAGLGVPPMRLDDLAAAPNPFNPRTEIVFRLANVPAGNTPVTVDLYDTAGRRVRRLWDGPLAAGRHRLTWDGRDDAGAALASGLYLVRVRWQGGMERLKLTLAR